MPVRGRLGRRRRGWRRGRCEGRETSRGQSARDAQPSVLPELPGSARLVLGEQHEENAEAVGDAVLHDAREDVACGQECAACLGGLAGGEEQGAL